MLPDMRVLNGSMAVVRHADEANVSLRSDAKEACVRR